MAQRFEVELGPGDGGELEHRSRLRRVAREPLAHDLAHGRRRAELGRRPDEARSAGGGVDRIGVDQLPPELRDEERVATGQLGHRGAQLVGWLGAGREADELPDLGVGEPAEPDPDHTLGARDVDERVGEAGGYLPRGVPVRRDDQHARVCACPNEVPQEEERRGVCPVHVLEHEEKRRATAGVRERVGDGGVQAVTLGVRIDGRDLGGAAGTCREPWQQATELAVMRAERRRRARPARARRRAARAPR